MNKIKKIFTSIIISTIISFFLLLYLGRKINPTLYKYSNIESKRFVSNIVNSTINDIISKEYDGELFTINKNSNDEIEILDYDTKKVNKLLSKITKSIKEKLTNLEDGNIKDLELSSNFKIVDLDKNGVLCEIPIGALYKNVLFNNIGPTIPIKLSFIGGVESTINTKISNYGINNLMLEINVKVVVEEQITMPKLSKKSHVEFLAPLTIKIIEGKIPNYYINGIESASNIISTALK